MDLEAHVPSVLIEHSQSRSEIPLRLEASATEAEPKSTRLGFASIITVSVNHRQRLEAYFPSILQSKGNYEIIISDNGSSDGSIESVKALYRDVMLLQNGANLGFAEACNRGARVAAGEFLVFINPDTTVEPDWLVNLLEPFRDPSVGLVTPKILLMQQPDRINTCGNVIHVSGIAQCRGINRPRNDLNAREEVNAVSGAAFAIRRDLFEQLGGFDQDFFLYVEETDLSIRARIAGWKCMYEPSSIVYHDYRLKFGPHKIFHQERNRYLTILKNYSWTTILALLPTFLLAEVVTWGFCFITGDPNNLRNKIDAYRWILANWSIIRQKHGAVQGLRKVRDREILSKCTPRINFRQVTHISLARVAETVFNSSFSVLKLVTLAFIR